MINILRSKISCSQLINKSKQIPHLSIESLINFAVLICTFSFMDDKRGQVREKYLVLRSLNLLQMQRQWYSDSTKERTQSLHILLFLSTKSTYSVISLNKVYIFCYFSQQSLHILLFLSTKSTYSVISLNKLYIFCYFSQQSLHILLFLSTKSTYSVTSLNKVYIFCYFSQQSLHILLFLSTLFILPISISSVCDNDLNCESAILYDSLFNRSPDDKILDWSKLK